MRESRDAEAAEGGMLAPMITRGMVAVFKELCAARVRIWNHAASFLLE
jgi:Flp pilus assembly pilin Flp